MRDSHGNVQRLSSFFNKKDKDLKKVYTYFTEKMTIPLSLAIFLTNGS